MCLSYITMWTNYLLNVPIFLIFDISQLLLHRNSVDFSRIWTRIAGVEGEHNDH